MSGTHNYQIAEFLRGNQSQGAEFNQLCFAAASLTLKIENVAIGKKRGGGERQENYTFSIRTMFFF